MSKKDKKSKNTNKKKIFIDDDDYDNGNSLILNDNNIKYNLNDNNINYNLNDNNINNDVKEEENIFNKLYKLLIEFEVNIKINYLLTNKNNIYLITSKLYEDIEKENKKFLEEYITIYKLPKNISNIKLNIVYNEISSIYDLKNIAIDFQKNMIEIKNYINNDILNNIINNIISILNKFIYRLQLN